jgi:hypothetical protein
MTAIGALPPAVSALIDPDVLITRALRGQQ